MILREWLMRIAIATAMLFFVVSTAQADILLSDLIVELQPGKQLKDDVEVWNNSPDRAYIAVEPREILDAGTADERVRTDPDPEKLGLLVTPARMVLEPGQRKLVRLASLAPPSEKERIFRVTVKPVLGEFQSKDTGLKIVVGYDVLVIVRPITSSPGLSAIRSGRTLKFTNTGNVSIELVDGRQCDSSQVHCVTLPGKRLYAGATWSEQLQSDLPVQYTLRELGKVLRRTF